VSLIEHSFPLDPRSPPSLQRGSVRGDCRALAAAWHHPHRMILPPASTRSVAVFMGCNSHEVSSVTGVTATVCAG
jgi:hypothetical protein